MIVPALVGKKMMCGGIYSHVNGEILKPFLLPQMPYYPSQLSATSREIPQKCLNVKTLTFPMVMRIYPVQTNCAKKLSAYS